MGNIKEKIIEKGSGLVVSHKIKKQLNKILPKSISKQISKQVGKVVELTTSKAIDLYNRFIK
jgi:mRNA-degrading endonuclease RelE of RelBE toxin-antitoxin system